MTVTLDSCVRSFVAVDVIRWHSIAASSSLVARRAIAGFTSFGALRIMRERGPISRHLIYINIGTVWGFCRKATRRA